jgi:RyR domain
MRVISVFEQGCKSTEFGDATLEIEAKANHEAYLKGLGPNERASAVSWHDLPENLKESNRWGVLHGTVKKRIWEMASEVERPQLLEHLSQSEHGRWMAEKVMDGWRGGVARDNIRRIHPDIKPFGELTEEGREKDRVQVRRSLGII